MFNTAVTKKKHGRAAPKMRHHASSKSSISNHSSSSSSSSDEELVIRRKNLPSVKGEADSTSARHRRPSSRSSVEKGHSRRLCHPHPSPHHYHAQQTYSLDRSHPHVGHASGWCPPPTWSASPSSWLYPPADIYPAMQQQRASCCCCHTPTVSCQPETDERVQRLEGDKDSLQMQVSILMDQIEAQTEKIADLERTLSDRAFQLQKSEDNFQKEMLSRSAAETRQLELLSDISGLKLRFAAMEKDNMELRGQLKRSEQDMITLVSQCYALCGATLGPGFNKKDMLENLQSMNLRSNATSPASVVGTPPRHPGSATAEFPRRALLSANSASSLQSNQSPHVTDSPRPTYQQSPKTPPASVFRKLDQDAYNSLPRQTSVNSHHNNNNNSLSTAGNSPPVTASKRAVVFGKHFQLPSLHANSKRSTSAPNLG